MPHVTEGKSLSGLIIIQPQKCHDLLNPMLQDAGGGGLPQVNPEKQSWGGAFVKKLTRATHVGVLTFWEGTQSAVPAVHQKPRPCRICFHSFPRDWTRTLIP